MKKHVDVGEKIGGARKDFYVKSLNLDDFANMNEAEREALVVKDNIFPPVNWRQWKEDGVTPQTAFIVKSIRDGLETKITPFFSKRFDSLEKAQSMYIKAMTEINQTLTGRGVEGGKAPKTVVELMPRVMKLLEPMIKVTVLQAETEDELAIGCLMREGLRKNKFFHRFANDTAIIYAKYFKDLDAHFYDRYGNLSQERLLEEALRRIDYEVGHKTGGYEHEYLNPETDSKKKDLMWSKLIRASKTLTEEEKAKRKAKRESEEILHRPHLEHVTVEGQRRDIHRHVDEKELLNEFGFRGIEFGNWLSNIERQEVIDFAYDAFDDLASALEVPRKAISLGGKLALGFGSRGVKGALAHYEPLRNVINLTRLKGAGCLAHEWFHAFDYYSGLISENSLKVINALKVADQTMENLVNEDIDNLNKINDSYVRGWLNFLPSEEQTKVKQTLNEIFSKQVVPTALNKILNDSESPFEKDPQKVCEKRHYIRIQDFNHSDFTIKLKNEIQRMISAQVLNQIGEPLKQKYNRKDEIEIACSRFCRGANLSVTLAFKMAELQCGYPTGMQTDNEFYKRAKKIDSKYNKNYWATLKEMFARAGASYTHDLLAKDQKRNDYLVFGTDPELDTMPTIKDREQIYKMFDDVFDQWREKVKDLECEPIVKSWRAPVIEAPVAQPKPTEPTLTMQDVQALIQTSQASHEQVGEFQLMPTPLILSVRESEQYPDRFVVQTFDDSSMEQGGFIEYQLIPKESFNTAVNEGRLIVEGRRLSAFEYERTLKEVEADTNDDVRKHCATYAGIDNSLGLVTRRDDALVWITEDNLKQIRGLFEQNCGAIQAAVNDYQKQLKQTTRSRGR